MAKKSASVDYPRTAKERLALAEFDARGFGHGCDHSVETHLREIEGADTRPEFHRFARQDGRIVARLRIVELTLRIGRARVRMGGIGDVQTDPACRGRGLASACIEDAIGFMRRDGFDLSVLFGIRGFYARFGYVGCLPGYEMRLQVRDLESLRNRFRVETPKDPPGERALSELLPLYEAAAAGTPGTVVRDRMRISHGLVVFREERGSKSVRAYVVRGRGGVAEVGLAPGDEEAAAAVLAWLRDRCVERLEAALELDGIPPAHPLSRFARRFNHEEVRSLSWDGNGMGRVINVASFLEKLAPELEARLASAGIDDECRLHFALTPESGGRRRKKPVAHDLILGAGHHFAMARRGVMSAKVKCSEGALLQMALGTLDVDSIPGMDVSGDRALVRAAFPQAAPAIWRLDRF